MLAISTKTKSAFGAGEWTGTATNRERPAPGAPYWQPRVALLLAAAAIGVTEAKARDFRVNMIPNGNTFRCANCHLSPGGGGPRTPFGQAVNARVTPGGAQPFWDAVLAGMDSDGDGATNGEELGDPEGDGVATPGVQVFNPGSAASTPPPPPPVEIDAAAMPVFGAAGALNWDGGKGPFLVWMQPSLGSAEWMPVLSTADRTAHVPLVGNHGFFRVEDAVGRTVIPLTVWLSAAAAGEAIDSPGRGYGLLALEGDTLTYHIPFAGLVDGATAAHIHGPADSATSAGVLQPLEGAVGVAGALTGTAVITAATREPLLAGRTYVNIHTPTHPGGEIRGQVAPVEWQAALSGASQIEPIPTSGTGTATFQLLGNQLFWSMTWTDLSAGATAAHIHGPADASQSAGVLVPLPGVSGASGSASGTATLTLAQLLPFIDGRTYVNIHTPTHPGGEIRGQVEPAP
ncbi:MAG: CHRD domain-containing protein [Verrucomicrobiales bacterium]|nr:CHRD domain-containing protein [Verrucomicrobiales bacterium]MCP5527655.1 CHRD domain-containing protein [Verrucomicrobiales bacterium]